VKALGDSFMSPSRSRRTVRWRDPARSATLATPVTAIGGGNSVGAKFQIVITKAGQYRWVLLRRGCTLATSPTYASKAAAQNGMTSFRKAAADAPLVDVTLRAATTPAGKAGRVPGRAVGRAVVKSGRAVEQVEGGGQDNEARRQWDHERGGDSGGRGDRPEAQEDGGEEAAVPKRLRDLRDATRRPKARCISGALGRMRCQYSQSTGTSPAPKRQTSKSSPASMRS
jgi:uncharacterized protein YegP (UPF0339 family)